jgi:hypothetical protein
MHTDKEDGEKPESENVSPLAHLDTIEGAASDSRG